nr:MAG TPA: hypothetical protein [Caudoviricetes sp.]
MGLLVLFSCLMMAVYMVAFCIRQKGILLWVYTVAKIRSDKACVKNRKPPICHKQKVFEIKTYKPKN